MPELPSIKMTSDQIVKVREYRYRRSTERAIASPEQARDFVSEVGFCFFWPIKDIQMPSLFHAIAGRVRDVPHEHGDPDVSRSWSWKDNALGKRWWYYGKLLRRRATLISLDLLPHFYAASDNYGDLTDYLDEYSDGLLTAEAKDIYEALLNHGPLETIRLRRESRMSAEKAKARFNRALVELQVGLKVIPTGVADAGAWHYSFVYDILQRHYPELVGKARLITRSKAQEALINRYIENVVAVERRMVHKIFYALKWTTSEIDTSIDRLISRGTVVEGYVTDINNPLLVTKQQL
jgi:hypothetical protein